MSTSSTGPRPGVDPGPIVEIDGLTQQPGSAPNQLATGFNATNLITLNGFNLRSHDPPGRGDPGIPGEPGPPGADTHGVRGLEIRADSGTVRGLRFIGFLLDGNLTNLTTAILIANARSNGVEACVFGADPSYSLAGPNYGAITLTNAAFCRIGGTLPAQRNLMLSHPGFPIRFLHSVSNLVEGNFIGQPGFVPAASISQGVGLALEGGGLNRIGGPAPGARNYFTQLGQSLDHDLRGSIHLWGSHTNQVLGNWFGYQPPEVLCVQPGVGTAPCRLAFVGSGGVRVENSRYTRVGGLVSGEGNLIAGNLQHGVSIVESAESEPTPGNAVLSNRIGPDLSGTVALPNASNGVRVLARASATASCPIPLKAAGPWALTLPAPRKPVAR